MERYDSTPTSTSRKAIPPSPSEPASPPPASAAIPAIGDVLPAACPLCGRVELEVRPFRYAFKERFLYGAECRACALTSICPQPTDHEIAEMYSDEYFTENSETCGAHGPAAYMELAESTAADRRDRAADLDVRLRTHFRAHLRGPRGDGPADHGSFLEVGCGPGFFLAEMKRLGWETHGLELSEFAARHARETLDLEITTGAIAPGVFGPEQFDVAFLGDVLEHLPRPLEDLVTLRSWLKPQGLCVVAVPSTLNLVSARLGMAFYARRGRFKTLRIPPYHLFEYTPGTLRKMLTAAGFDVLSVRQSAVPLARMGLRGSALENLAKVALQVPAIISSKILNRGGDRLLAVARPASPTHRPQP